MNKILFYLGESSFCLLVFYLLYALLLRRETGFQYNRFYLLITPLVSLVLPLVRFPFFWQPKPLLNFVSTQLAPITIYSNTASAPEGLWFTGEIMLLAAYALGFCFFTFRVIRQLYQLRQFTRQTQATSFWWRGIRVHQTNGKQGTFSFGNCIFWDNSQSLSASENERIFLHEAVHIRQKHSLDILYFKLLRLIFWFNPLLYFYQKALITTHEFIADAAVLRTTPPDAYARLLAKQVLHRLEFSFGQYFNKSLNLNRMKMIQQTHRHPNKLKQLAALPFLGFVLLVLSCTETEEPLKDPAGAISESQATAQNDQAEPVFTFVEQNPVFPGGLEKMYGFLGSNIKYPATAVKANLEGNVIAQFVVTKEGKIKDVRIVKSLSPETDAEARRVISQMPTWEPGKQNGNRVNVEYTLPIKFSLGANEPKKAAKPTKIGYYWEDSRIKWRWITPLQNNC